jgi:hypothetical protein
MPCATLAVEEAGIAFPDPTALGRRDLPCVELQIPRLREIQTTIRLFSQLPRRTRLMIERRLRQTQRVRRLRIPSLLPEAICPDLAKMTDALRQV